MRNKAIILLVTESALLAYILLRREQKRRNSVFYIMEENKKQIELLKTQIGTSGYSIESMFEENAQLRHKLAVEILKFEFIQRENNDLRQELYKRSGKLMLGDSTE